MGCLWLISRLPYQWQLATGRKIGVLISHLLPSRRRVTNINLQLAFPDSSEQERAGIAYRVYEHIGMSLAEGATAWFRPLSFYRHYFEIQGLEHLENARKNGRGVIILQAHFTVIEAAAAVIGSQVPLSAVVDRPKNALFGELLKFYREKNITETIENDNIRRMVRKLRNNEIVWYSPDLYVPPHVGGILTRYFNTPALTTDGIARISKLTGATIVPFIPTRLNQQGYATLAFQPPLEPLDATDLAKTTQSMNDLFEHQIRQQPDQYFWVHKRFKSPAPGIPDPYQ